MPISSGPKSKHTCCICGLRNPEKYKIQARPTGSDGKLEKWKYCIPCWEDYSAYAFRETPVGERRYVNMYDAPRRSSHKGPRAQAND
jgi:hypothetical protein